MYTYLTPEEDGLPMREAGPWAEVKLDYLARYIDVFETSMRDKWPVRNYVDLLAGPGKNRVRGEGTILLGSPLIALTTRHPFTGYWFVEYDAANAEALRQRCSAWREPARIRIEVGDCNSLVDGIVADLKREDWHSLNLAFVDPEGLELKWTTVAKLASVQRMDLIVIYPENALNRYMSTAVCSPGDTKVDAFFGDRAWRAMYEDWQNTRRPGLHRRLIDLYRERLGALGYQDIQGAEGLAEPLVRNVTRRAPLYRLLFASKHPLGTEFWLKITKRDAYGQARLFER